MLGDIYYTEYINKRYKGMAGTHYASATTDNQGNSYILAKHMPGHGTHGPPHQRRPLPQG